MLKIIISFLVYSCWVNISFAIPYIPISPTQVLEKLPANSSTSSKEFKNLRALLNTNPNNIENAARLAKLYIERSRIEGDPRYLGYAQAALAPWWKLSEPPIDILVLRATLLQSTHHFDLSLADLDKVLKLDPRNSQAWITRATILQVQGKYAEAYASCEQLYKLAPALITLTCATNVHDLNGQAEKSYQKLKAGYAESGETNPSIQVWVLTLLAEMATRLDDVTAAEKYYQHAIKLEEPDSYLLGAYSDFLLDQKRPLEVIQILKNKTRIDALLLRYAEALSAINSPEANMHIDALRQRFAAAMLRGDTVHQREQSRFELRLMKNPIRALEIAKLNWLIQKEPADTRVYIEAAVADKDNKSILTLTQWLDANHQEDIAIKRILAKYKSAP